MQSEHIVASSDTKGVAHLRQDGPQYFSIPAQHLEQKGARMTVSGALPHEGHSEGYTKLSSRGIRPAE